MSDFGLIALIGIASVYLVRAFSHGITSPPCSCGRTHRWL